MTDAPFAPDILREAADALDRPTGEDFDSDQREVASWLRRIADEKEQEEKAQIISRETKCSILDARRVLKLIQ